MAKVKQTISFVLILTQICWLQAAPADDKNGAPPAAEVVKAGQQALAAIPNKVMVEAAADFVLKSSFMPKRAKYAAWFTRMSWDAVNSLQDGNGMKAVAIAALESTVRSASDVHANNGGAVIKIAYGILKDVAEGKEAKTVLTDIGRNLIRSHLPEKGSAEAQKQIKVKLTEMHGERMGHLVDTAISVGIVAKSSKSPEDVIIILMKTGTGLIEKEQEALLNDVKKNYPDVNWALVEKVSDEVSKRVDEGKSYADAIKDVAVEKADMENLKLQIYAGGHFVEQIGTKSGVAKLVDLIPVSDEKEIPKDTTQYVQEKAKELCMRMPGAWPDCGSDSESDSKSKGKSKSKK